MPLRSKARRLDVMLSSTSKDLPTHREQARQGVLRVGMHPIAMETLTASPRDAITESLKLVDDAEIYIGIFAMRYGHRPKDARNPDDLSITELEYRHAMAKGKVVLIFLMADDHPGPATAAEGDTFYEPDAVGKEKLMQLKAELKDRHVVGFFNSPEDLRAHIIQALGDPDVIERARAIAGEDDADSGAEDESPLPAPPAFYADPPYTLTSQFVGRSAELAQLDAWAQSDDPLMLVEAIGGMGKSAVTWEWVQSRALTAGYDGVMWWSFYESGATMTAFLRHALAYLTQGDPEKLKGGDRREHFRQLQRLLKGGRYLLVLDGLERVLVAYHRWNAAQMRDDSVEEAESIIKERDIRACTDPVDEDILKGLLACAPSQILISSRLIPLALEDRTGTRSRGVAHLHLNGLHPADALALTRHAGVKVHDERVFTAFVGTFGGHSLLVKLVAGRINKFRRARGDFDAWYAAEGRTLTISDYDLRQHQTHILQYAFAGLALEALRFLSQIAAFGDAVEYKVLEIFNPFVLPAPEMVAEPDTYWEEQWRDEAETEEEKQQYQQEIDDLTAPYHAYLEAKAEHDAYLKSQTYRKALTQFDALLSELEERGLLRWEADKDHYDMHPVVRGTAYDRLEAESRAQTFARIRGHFEAQTEDIDAATEVSDLTNTIAIYRALLGAGQMGAAANFYRIRLEDKLHYTIAAYYTVIELLTPLFADGTNALPRLSDPALQSSITHMLANMFYYIGRTDEALVLHGLNLKLDLDRDADKGNLIISLQSCSLSLLNENQLALAEHTLQAALALAEATKDSAMITRSRLYLLGIDKDAGQWDAVEAIYAEIQSNPPEETLWQTDVERYYAESLIARGLDAQAALDKAERLAIHSKDALNYRQIKRGRGEVAMYAEDSAAAQRWFEEALALCRKAGEPADGVLGGLARAYAHQGDHARALEIVETTDFRHEEIVNAAEVYLLTGDRERARTTALKAYERAWADGPPYVWWWHLERAKVVLDALGEPYPVLPPFDPAKVGKYPYQDEIEAYIARKREEYGMQAGEE